MPDILSTKEIIRRKTLGIPKGTKNAVPLSISSDVDNDQK